MRIVKSIGRREGTCQEDLDAVRQMIREVRAEGDAAVLRYTQKFDGKQARYEVSPEERRRSISDTDPKLVGEMRKAARNIRRFSWLQNRSIIPFKAELDGNIVGQKLIPIEKAGCYVPGGRYPLVSTALMTIIPAKTAGVDEVIVCSPRISKEVIAACEIAGADRIFSIGGAQAVAALAFGTETVPKVDKIVGPGNRFVALAKKEVYGTTGIDFVAGPSEILIIADDQADPRFVAADLLAQAEHDTDARLYLVVFSRMMAHKVCREIDRQLTDLPTRAVAEASLGSGEIYVAKDADEAISISDQIAPEHLEIMTMRPGYIASRARNFGSLFIGSLSAESFGDYCTGPNHTLPTAGASRYTGGLSVLDFLKVVTYQELSARGARALSRTAQALAKAEGLEGHRRAAGMR